jgi:nitrate/TMAO reductase-like tetraheme cytochrome c subunit
MKKKTRNQNQDITPARKSSGKILFLIVIIFLICFGGYLQASSRPGYCVKCHVMRSYFEPWSNSSHKDVSCITCHYPPGNTGFLSRKMVGLKMEFKGMTSSYSGRLPLAKLSNSSCSSPSCHTLPLSADPLEFKTVKFSHNNHLTAQRRGKELTCSSCHSNIVHGKLQISTPETCFLCHLRPVEDASLATSFTSQCTLCHKRPQEIIQKNGIEINHLDKQTSSLECTKCHQQITSGDGKAPSDKCIQCHADEAVVEKMKDPVLIHGKHVSEWGITCTRCHSPVQHSLTPIEKPAGVDCLSCHPNHHEAERLLYNTVSFGQGEDYASPEFVSHIECKACHTTKTGDRFDPSGVLFLADSQSCTECHTASYSAFLGEWQTEMNSLIADVRKSINETRPKIQATSFSVKKKDELTDILNKAEVNLLIAERGKAVHNLQYSDTLVRKAFDKVNSVLTEIGKPQLKSKRIEARKYASGERCYECHFSSANSTVTFGDITFPHTPHLADGKLPCISCHEFKSKWESHGKLKFSDPSGCKQCHGKSASCASCHTGFESNVLETFNSAKSFIHQPHISSGMKCIDCHYPESSERKHGELKLVNASECNACHHSGEKIQGCTGCHDIQNALMKGEILNLTQSVKGFHSALKCESCHDVKRHSRSLIEKKCIDCHDSNYPRKVSDWQKQADDTLIQVKNLISRSEKLALSTDEVKQLEEIKGRYNFLSRDKKPGVHNPNLWRKVFESDTKTLRDWLAVKSEKPSQ